MPFNRPSTRIAFKFEVLIKGISLAGKTPKLFCCFKDSFKDTLKTVVKHRTNESFKLKFVTEEQLLTGSQVKQFPVNCPLNCVHKEEDFASQALGQRDLGELK